MLRPWWCAPPLSGSANNTDHGSGGRPHQYNAFRTMCLRMLMELATQVPRRAFLDEEKVGGRGGGPLAPDAEGVGPRSFPRGPAPEAIGCQRGRPARKLFRGEKCEARGAVRGVVFLKMKSSLLAIDLLRRDLLRTFKQRDMGP